MAFIVISLVTGERCGFRPVDGVSRNSFLSNDAAELMLDICISLYNTSVKREEINGPLFVKEEFLIVERELSEEEQYVS